MKDSCGLPHNNPKCKTDLNDPINPTCIKIPGAWAHSFSLTFHSLLSLVKLLRLEFSWQRSLRCWHPQENTNLLSQTARSIFKEIQLSMSKLTLLSRTYFVTISLRHQIQEKILKYWIFFVKSNFWNPVIYISNLKIFQ